MRQKVSLTEPCELCGVIYEELIDGLCRMCNPDSHEHEENLKEQINEEQLWKE